MISTYLRRIGFVLMLLLGLFSINISASSYTLDPDLWVSDGIVYSVVEDSDNVYIGGEFYNVGPNTGPAAEINKNSGERNKDVVKANGYIWTAISDGQGGWYIGGSFTIVGSLNRNRIAHIESNGSIDPNFNPNADSDVYSLALSGSYLYVGGSFNSIGGALRAGIAKININTGLADATFNPSSNSVIYSLIVSGTDLYAGGSFTTIGGTGRNRIARMNTSTGIVDPGFDPSADSTIYSLLLEGEDLYVGGAFTNILSTARNRIAKMSITTGLIDGSFNPNAGSSVRAMAIHDSDIFVGGDFTTIAGVSRTYLAKLDKLTGAIDDGFNLYISSYIRAIAVADDEVYIGGDFESYLGKYTGKGAELNKDTSVFNAAMPVVNGTISAVASDGSGGWIIGGSFTQVGSETRNRIAHILSDGSVDPAFNPNANNIVYTVEFVDPYVYAGGTFTNIGGQPRNRIAKLDIETGLADATFNPNASSMVYKVCVSDTNLYAMGDFTSIGSLSAGRIAKLDTTTGALDPSFNVHANTTVQGCDFSGDDMYISGVFNYLGEYTGTGVKLHKDTAVIDSGMPEVNGTIRSVISDGLGGWYIGGEFTTVGGLTRNRVAHILPDKSVDPAFDPNANNVVYTLALSGSYLYVGGNFTNIGGSALNRLARVNTSDGLADAGFNPNASSYVLTIVISGSDIFAGGYFTTIGGSSRSYIAKLNATTGVADGTFNPGANNYVWTLNISGDDLYVGGDFTTIAGSSRSYIAKMSATSGTLDGTFSYGFGGKVRSTVLSGTSLYIGGEYYDLVKINSVTGIIDSEFDVETNYQWVYSMAISGTDLYISGQYINDGSYTGYDFKKVDAGTGDNDEDFDIKVGEVVRSVAIYNDDLYAGGYFTSMGGEQRIRLAKIDKLTGEIDLTFNPTNKASILSGIRAIKIDGDNLYVGGSFYEFNSESDRNLVKINKNTGATDDAFFVSLGSTAMDIYTLSYSEGYLYLGGAFSYVQGNKVRNFAKVNGISGELDTSFKSSTSGSVFASRISGDDIYIGGDFLSVGGDDREGIFKLDEYEEIDGAFKANTNDDLYSIGTYSSNLFVGGEFTSIGVVERIHVAKMNLTTGEVDQAFNPIIDPSLVDDLCINDSDLYIAGTFTSINGVESNKLAKVSKNTGDLDIAFNADADWEVRQISIYNNSLYAAGDFSTIGGLTRNRLAKLDLSTGEADPSFADVNPDDTVWSLEVNDAGLYLGGYFENIGGYEKEGLAKLDPLTGEVDDDFTLQTPGLIYSTLKVEDDLFVGGSFTYSEAPVTGRGVEIDSDTGELNNDIPEVNGTIYSSLSDGAGGWYIGGSFTSVGGTARSNIAHLLSDGTLDGSFDPAVNGTVNVMELSGTDIFIGGAFTTVDGTTRNRIAKLNASGDLDATFDANASSSVLSIEVESGYVYMGGYFTSVGGTPRNRIAKVNATSGALDGTFNPGASSSVEALFYYLGYIYAGGSFTTIGSQSIPYLARLDPTSGIVDTDFSANVGGSVKAIEIDNDEIYIGGGFKLVDNEIRYYLAKLDIDGDLDPTFNIILNGSSGVTDLAISGTELYIAGYITSIDGVFRRGIAKVSTISGAIDLDFEPMPASYPLTVSIYNNKAFIGGSFDQFGEGTYFNLVKVNAYTGELDYTFNPRPDDTVWALSGYGSSLFVGGYFFSMDSEYSVYIAELDIQSGDRNSDLNHLLGIPRSSTNKVFAIDRSTDRLYIGGDFDQIDLLSQGNFASFTIDDDRAVLSSINPPTGSTITTRTPTITFTTNEVSTCRLSTADESYDEMADNINCTGGGTSSHSCTSSNLGEDGLKKIYIACVDNGNNKDSVATNTELTYILDTTPPSLSQIYPIPGITIYDRTPRISFATDENSSCRLSLYDESFIDMANNVECEGNGTTSHLCRSSYLGLDDGEKNIYLSCMDIAGNAHTNANNIQIDYTLDTYESLEESVIKDITVVINEDGSVVISWSTDIDAVTSIKYAKDDENVIFNNVITLDDEARNGIRSITLNDLEKGYIYIYEITAVLNDGSIQTYSNEFTTYNDSEFITFIWESINEIDNTILISFSVLRPSLCSIKYGDNINEKIYEGEVDTGTDELNKTAFISTKGLISDIYYTFECENNGEIFTYDGVVIYEKGNFEEDNKPNEDVFNKVVNSVKGFVGSDQGRIVMYSLAAGPVLGLAFSGFMYLPEFLYYGLFILKRKSTGKRLGVVYDKHTLLPISFAVIKVFDQKGNFVYETVSDIKGRYSSEILNEGEYEFRVEHSDYEPFIKKFRVRGEMDFDFGLKGLKANNIKGVLSRIRVTFVSIRDNFLDILILTGFLYSFLCMLLNPELVNILIVLLYFSQYVIRVIIHSRKSNGGTIVDNDGKGIKGAFVRVYDKNALQLDTNITTQGGHYRFNVSDGKYFISIYKEGYDIDRNGLSNRLIKTDGGLELIECNIHAGVPDIVIKMRHNNI